MDHKAVHFLLVEDDDDHAELVEMALTAENGASKSVDRVSNGEEALAYLKREGKYANRPRPNLVLLDLKLPRVDGHEVLVTMKSDPELRSIPVVVLTTSQAPEDKAKAYANYANSYLAKPMDFGEFSRMVKDLSHYWTVWNQPLS
ncbi:MAG TPA: response regulator [Phycisphaerae bacterium]|nr:response regulator [Phycisphaerae bacterium]